jgi:hypothetical protein
MWRKRSRYGRARKDVLCARRKTLDPAANPDNRHGQHADLETAPFRCRGALPPSYWISRPERPDTTSTHNELQTCRRYGFRVAEEKSFFSALI